MSMKYADGKKVEYNFRAAESAIRNRFVAGKPRVQVRTGEEMPTHISFRNDVHAGHVRASLKGNIRQVNPVISHSALASLVLAWHATLSR
jgi:hypothetical protein